MTFRDDMQKAIDQAVTDQNVHEVSFRLNDKGELESGHIVRFDRKPTPRPTEDPAPLMPSEEEPDVGGLGVRPEPA
jgi:hypothetical protein